MNALAIIFMAVLVAALVVVSFFCGLYKGQRDGIVSMMPSSQEQEYTQEDIERASEIVKAMAKNYVPEQAAPTATNTEEKPADKVTHVIGFRTSK